MAGNLTRDEARERARLLTVESYDGRSRPDRRAGRAFGLDHDDPVRLRRARRGDLRRPAGPTVREVTLNGRALDPASYDGTGPHRAARAGRGQRAAWSTRTRLHPHRRGPAPLRRPGGPAGLPLHQFERADARRVFASFEQPDLKATFALTRDGARGLDGRLQRRAGRGRRRGCWHFPATPRISTYITALVAGPYHVVRDEYLHGRRSGRSRWASTAAPRWPSTSTPTRSSRSPGRASTSSSENFDSRTRSASTTSCSCRSSTRARWRTRAA